MSEFCKGLIPFWDDHLIDTRFSTAELSVNKPHKVGKVITFDQPLEGNGTDFFTVVKEDDFYRLYYEAWSFDTIAEEGINVCYAESRDGIHWEKPNLGMCEFRGSKDNNIIMTRISDNITVMKDPNPDCPPEQKYKALMMVKNMAGYANIPEGYTEESWPDLVSLVSADGIHFEKFSVVSCGYDYDTQNTLHWNRHTGKYYVYFREFHPSPDDPQSPLHEPSVRGIRVCESVDFIHWTEPKTLNFMGGDDYPLYVNAVMAYPYDDRYYIGFPSRYVERRGWTKNFDRLCGREKRLERMQGQTRFGTAVTDCLFMSSRDNYNWYRFDEATISPGPETPVNWVYGDCFVAVGGLIETPSRFDYEPNELSVLVGEHHWMDVPGDLMRYTYRMDGFASVKAPYARKTLRTKAFTFEGENLKLNFRTSARGNIYVRILNERGIPLEGYSSCEIFGDSLDRIIDFDKPLAELQGQTIILDFDMSDAEIYAMKFE